MLTKEYILENRAKLLEQVQAVYSKHGIVVDVTDAGASIRFTKGKDVLMDAIADEAEVLAQMVSDAVGFEGEAAVYCRHWGDADPDDSFEGVTEVPPTPPGAKAGQWIGKWTRTFTGTFTESE